MGGDVEHRSISMAPNDEIAPQTTEPHFTEPVKREQTTYTIDRYTHRVPVDWFLVAAGEIDAWTYEQYVANEQQFDEKTVNHAVEAVDLTTRGNRIPTGRGNPSVSYLATPRAMRQTSILEHATCFGYSTTTRTPMKWLL